MKTTILTIAAAVLTLAGCTSDETDNWAGEIRLSSGITVQQQTRATHNLDASLKKGESVHVWVDDAKDTQTTITKENLYENNVLTVGDNGALSGTAMYFPQSGNKVNIYALHTNASLSGNTFPGELTHTVAQDQQSSVDGAGAGYQGSDLVFAKSTDVARSAQAVKLDFKHLLSKIEVVLVQGKGTPTISKVEILNTKLGAKFTPSKTADFSVTVAGELSADSNPIVIDNGTTSAENAAKTNTDEGKVLNEAIIVPQTLTTGTTFIRITTTDGGVLTYSLEGETTFASGNKYRYTITANLTGLTVSSAISPWGDGSNTSGTAEM